MKNSKRIDNLTAHQVRLREDLDSLTRLVTGAAPRAAGADPRPDDQSADSVPAQAAYQPRSGRVLILLQPEPATTGDDGDFATGLRDILHHAADVIERAPYEPGLAEITNTLRILAAGAPLIASLGDLQ